MDSAAPPVASGEGLSLCGQITTMSLAIQIAARQSSQEGRGLALASLRSCAVVAKGKLFSQRLLPLVLELVLRRIHLVCPCT